MSFNFDTFGTSTPKNGSFDFDSFGTDAGPLETVQPSGPGFLRGETTFPVDRNATSYPIGLGLRISPTNIAKTFGNIPSSYMKMAGGIGDIPEIYSTGKELLAQNNGSVTQTGVAVAKSALQDLKGLAESGFTLWKQMGESIYKTLEDNVELEGSTLKGAYEGSKQVGAEALGKVAEMALDDPLLIPSLLFAPEKIAGKGDRISQIAKPVSSKIEAGLEKRAIASDANKIKRVELQNKDLRTAMDFSADANAGARDRITRSNVLQGAINEDGVITTLGKNGPLERYKALTIGNNEGIVRDMLKVEYQQDKSIVVSIPEIRTALRSEVLTSGLEGKALTQALRNVESELKGLRLRVDESGKVPLFHIQNSKISTTNGINYLTEPHVKTYSKAVGRAYRKIVENKSKLNVGEVNSVLEQFYKDADLLEGLNGKRVPGGKLGVFTSQIAGSMAGVGAGALIGGIPGAVLGGVVGQNLSKGLKQRTLKRYFNGKERPMEKSPVLEKAKQYVKEGQSSRESQVKTKTKTATSKGVIADTIPQKKGIVTRAVESVKESLRNPSIGLAIKDVGDEATVLNRATKYLREAKGLSASDIMKKYPEIQLKRDLTVKNIHGQKQVIPEGEVLTPYELKGNKVLLQDGKTYVVSKNQFQNVKGNALSGEAKDFAPELKGTEESVKTDFDMESEVDALLGDELGQGMTRAEARDYIEMDLEPSDGIPKYSQYTLPGGKNYKEILIKAPTSLSKLDTLLAEGKITPKQWQEGLKESAKNKEQIFKSSHWDELNVLAHLRMNWRKYKGKAVAFLEEIQSDWAREGQSVGYKDATDLPSSWKLQEDIKKEYPGINWVVRDKRGLIKASGETAEQARSNAMALVKDRGVPGNPLLKNWQTLAIKRALKEAVDSKAEYFAWINGEQTSARYNLATYVNEVRWGDRKMMDVGPGSTKTIKLTPKDTANRLEFGIDDSGVIRSVEDGVDPAWRGKKLDEVLGKGLADSIMAKESGTLSGEGLKFGGEWANNLYDKQVANIVSDLTGAKVEKLDLGLPVKDGGEVFYRIKSGGFQGEKLDIKNMKVGDAIKSEKRDSSTYIITDVLGDGKFKAVPTASLDDVEMKLVKKGKIDEAQAYRTKETPDFNSFDRMQETFDISQKTTTQQGIRLTPEVIAKIKGESPLTKKPQQRPLEELLAISKQTKTEIKPLIEEVKVLRGDQKPIGAETFKRGDSYVNMTDVVARERFDIPKLKKLSFGGSDRDVYDLGDGNVVKIAKSARGLAQNAMADYYASSQGLIPEIKEIGRNYVVFEKVAPPDANVRAMVKELSNVGLMNKTFFNNNTRDIYYKRLDQFLEIMDKHGYDGQELRNYGDELLWGDMKAIRNWGTKDGSPILLDEGSLNGKFVTDFQDSARRGIKNLDDPEFREIYNISKDLRKQYGDIGRKTMYGLTGLFVLSQL